MAFFNNRKGLDVMRIFPFLLFILIFSCTNSGEKKTIGTIGGTNIYKSNCSLCHGDDGKKRLADASDLSLTKLPESELITVIKKGRGAMAPFENVLSEDEIKAVAEHVQKLKTNK